MSNTIANPAEWIKKTIIDFTASSPENSLGMHSKEKAFDKPLIGFSSGNNQLYSWYKEHIGVFYHTPFELLTKTLPHLDITPENITVISWILPSTKKTRQEQAKQTKYPSERWARTRALGEDFNNALRRYVVKKLETEDIKAVAPLLSPHWSRSDQGPYAPCSNWSERHAAYAAGLGTFGLCDGLITPVGKAVRIGSVIAAITIPSSPRPYTDHHAYCLHFTHNTCRACIPRCPVKALSKKGHDKKMCMKYTEKTMNVYIKKTYNIDTYACGLCQGGVPCTDKIPTLGDLEKD